MRRKVLEIQAILDLLRPKSGYELKFGPMDLSTLNRELSEEFPSRLIVQSFDGEKRELVVAFTSDGGLREDSALEVRFLGAIIFHLPSVLHEEGVQFTLATPAEIISLIPRCSFDADELSGPPRGLSVVALVSSLGESFGYYVAAEDLTWSWKPRSDCAFAW